MSKLVALPCKQSESRARLDKDMEGLVNAFETVICAGHMTGQSNLDAVLSVALMSILQSARKEAEKRVDKAHGRKGRKHQ